MRAVVCALVAVAAAASVPAPRRRLFERTLQQHDDAVFLEIRAAVARESPIDTVMGLMDQIEQDTHHEHAEAEKSWTVEQARCQHELNGLRAEITAATDRVQAVHNNITEMATRQQKLAAQNAAKTQASHENMARMHHVEERIAAGKTRRAEAQARFEAQEHENKQLVESLEQVRAFVMENYKDKDSAPVMLPTIPLAETVVPADSVLLELQRTSRARRTTTEMRAALAALMKSAEEGTINMRHLLDMVMRMSESVHKSMVDAAQVEKYEVEEWAKELDALLVEQQSLLQQRFVLSSALARIARQQEELAAQYPEALARHKELRSSLETTALRMDATHSGCSHRHAVHHADGNARRKNLRVLASLRDILTGMEGRVQEHEHEAKAKREEEEALKRAAARPLITSCLQLLELPEGERETESGVYRLFADAHNRSSAYDAYCDMETDGGGWTLAAVVANDAEERWTTTAADGDLGDLSSGWESAETFGELSADTATTARDFKSPAFVHAPADQLLITFNGQKLLRTAPGCVRGKSLRDFFRANPFSCEGHHFHCYYGTGHCRGSCSHACLVEEQYGEFEKDVVTGGGHAEALLLKAGAATGAQDGNMNRAYISSFPSRQNVDYPEGLGAFRSFQQTHFSHDMSEHKHGVARPLDPNQYNAIFVRAARPGARAPRAEEARTSCAAHHAAGHTASGVYTLRPEGSDHTFPAYCDMETAGGGWTLVAVVSNSLDEHWTYDDSHGDHGSAHSLWESAESLGQVSEDTHAAAADFKSPAYSAIVADELMVSYRGQPLLRTSTQCLRHRTLRHALNEFRFSCTGAQRSCHYGEGQCAAEGGCTHECEIAQQFAAPADDVVTRGLDATVLYLKAGAADGAQDYNKDRAYLSTKEARDGYSFPTGLGAYVGFLNSDFSHNMGTFAKGVVRPRDHSLVNAIYVR